MHVASHHCTILECTELPRVTRSFTNVCINSLHALDLEFVSVAMEVMGTPEFSDLDRTVDTFGCVLYVKVCGCNMIKC